MKIIVTGSLGYDFIMDYSGRISDRIMPDKVHRISVSVLVDKLNKQLGGTAGNIAYTLKLLHTEPIIVAPAGGDFGPYRQFLEKNHISTIGIKVYSQETLGTYFVITDRDDNQIGAFYQGALKFADKLSVKPNAASASLVMVAPNSVPAMVKYVSECVELGMPYIFDPAFQISDFKAEDLDTAIKGATIVIGNDYEISLIEERLGISHEELILNAKILITTLGAKGSIIETRHDQIHIKPARAVNVSDPTGAGDAYRAGLIAGYARGYDLTTCSRMGSVAAVYTVEKYGTVTHVFTKKQFCDRYFENYQEKLKL